MPDSERASDMSRPDAIRLAAAFGVTLARAHPVAATTLELAQSSQTLFVPLSGDCAAWLDAVAAFLGSGGAWQLRARCDGSPFPVALTRGSDGQSVFDGPAELAARVSDVTRHVLAQLHAATSLDTLDLISPAEAARLAAWSGDEGDCPRGETVASAFAAIAAAHPALLAIDAEQSLTYAALSARVSRLAAQLAALGVKAGDTVAVFLERGVDQAAAPLAIMSLGAVYAPLHPGYPTARLALMLELSGATAIVTTSAARPTLDAALTARIAVLDVDRALDAAPTPPSPPCGPESPAYVMYTSGSTGVPKGVVVPHRAILRLVRDQTFCTFSPGDRVLAYAPTAFDASTLELFGPLLNGGTVVMPPPGPADLGALATFLRVRRIDTAWLTAALFHGLVDHAPEAFGGLRQLLAGGDVLSPTHVARALTLLPPGGRFVNGYGPTENTTFTACHVLDAGTALPESASAIPIGRPIRSTHVWLVDPTPRPGPLVRIPSFGVGELVTGGDGVALSYRDQPELTAERFVTVPFAAGAVYRTGDLARFSLDSGTTPPPLEFLGRRDQQVKIGGHRIELGEIEAALRAQPGVRDAVVLARKVAGSEDKTLHAWLVPTAGAALDPHHIRAALAEALPKAMVPSRLGVLDALPVTPNGKLARDQLPDLLSGRPEGLQTPFERPRSGLEAQVASAFEETLGFATGAVSALDSFFDLGGTSLLAIHASSRLKQRLGRPVPIVALFGSPTVRGLATRLSGAATASHAAPRAQKRHGDRTDVAIIGFAGRFPGAADVNALWTALLAGRELISFFGKDGSPGVHPDAPDRNDEGYVAARGIVEDADHLDAPFFGLSPRQAEVMDPQHRVFMEVAWEALEHAGYAAPVAPGAVGVFGGSDYNTYRPRYVDQRPDLEAAFGALQIRFGNDKDYVPITTAHRLNLHGPAVSVHTACSTSLVAIVQAVNALRAHQCELALAGGVNVVVPSRSGHVYSPGGMYSKDGHTRTFDQHASGTVFSDGCAIVTLRRLEDAEAAGDTIYAVIRGVGIDNDGAEKASFTAPSVSGQARCIAMALRDADVAPNDIDFVEAHGTGTPIGDPIEVAALTQAYAEVAFERGLPAPIGTCAIGSLKSNIGHLTAAAGGAGLIKAALSLHHGVLPKTLHITVPNPAIPFEQSPFRVAAAPVSLAQATARPPRAGVSALGVGGTNAHVVLEAWQPPAGAPPRCRSDRRAQLLLLSAKSAAALDRATERLADALTDLDDVAFTLATGRASFEHRRAIVVHSTPGCELPESPDPGAACRTPDLDRARARRTLEEQPGDRVRTGRAAGSPPIIALFPGQGSQTVDMGRELYATEPVFRQAMDAVFAVLPALRPVLYPDGDQRVGAEDRLRDTTWAQPALFAVEYALAQLTRSLGLEPAAYIGHSVGEFTAACLAGVMPLEDAIRLVALRGRLMAAMAPGKMLAVRQSAAKLEPGLPASLSLACSNAPELAVVAGPEDAITAYAASLAAQNVRTTLLVTSHAFHSHMMDGVLPAFGDAVSAIASVLRPPDRPIFSTATGARLTDAEAIDPGYWTRHVRATVRFAEAVQSAVAHFDGELPLGDVPLWVECGPRATAATFTRQTLARLAPGKAGAVVTLLDLAPAGPETDESGDPPDSEHRAFLLGIGELWTRGAPLDGAALFAAERRRRIPLPTYPFERKRHFADRPIAPAAPSPSNPEAPPPMPSPATPAPAPAAATDAHRTRLRGELTALVADLSGLPEESLDPARRFADHGFDSLFLTQLAQDLSRRFGQKFAFRDLAEKFASVDALASHLSSLLPAPVAAPPVLSPAATSPVSSAGAPPPALALPAIPTGAASQLLLGQIDLISQQLGLLRQVAAMTPAPAAPVVAPPTAPPPEPAHAVSAPSLAALAAAVPPQKPSPTGDPRPTKVRTWSDLSEEQAGALRRLISDMSTRTAASKAHVDAHRARHADPRTAAGFSPVWKEMVYPLVVARSKGARLWDLDGNEYIDLLNGFGPNFLGHADPGVTAAVAAQLERGFEVGPQTPLAGEAAALVCQLTGMDRASFTCTGSEAVQAAIRCARTVTRRDAIVVFTRDYHGNFDEVLVRAVNTKTALKTLPSAPGIPKRAVSDVIVLEYGADASLDIIRQLAPELAAVVVEPVQSRRPELQPRAFLHELRSITRESGTVLVFDEVVTGFRCHPGGAQAHFGVDADLATYGKVVAGGMPIGIVAGRRPIIDTFDGGPWHFGDASGPEAGVTFFAGTFVRHPLAIAAVHATLTRLVKEGPALQERVSAHTAAFAKRANALFERFEAPYEMPHFGSQLYLRNLDPSDLGVLFWYHLRLRGVHIQETFPSYFTVEHGTAEVDRLIHVFEESLDAMAEGGFLPPSTSRRKTAKAVASSGISSAPPVPGARLGKDPSGRPAWYAPDPARPGQYVKVS